MEKKGYNGKHTNANTQEIKAVNSQNHNPKGTIIHRGTDLRTGRTGKKK